MFGRTCWPSVGGNEVHSGTLTAIGLSRRRIPSPPVCCGFLPLVVIPRSGIFVPSYRLSTLFCHRSFTRYQPLQHLSMPCKPAAETRKYFVTLSIASLSSDDLADVQAQINANFSEQFADHGLDADSYDFFTTEFSANGSGLDAVLDLISIDIDFSAGSFIVEVNGLVYDYDADIDTDGITIGGGDNSNLDGEWTLTFSGTFKSGVTTTAIPAATIFYGSWLCCCFAIDGLFL
jgi:hypothetical protein